MITICLINPPLTIPVDARRVNVPPLGLAYLASILRQNPNNQVTILDAVAEGPGHESLAMQGFVTLGLSLDEIQLRLSYERPAIAGIAFVSSDQARNAHAVCERIKQLKRDKDIDITTVAGGPHVTAFPQDVMADLNIDYAIVGEGEIPFFKLCDAINKFKDPSDIAGVCYRDKGGRVQMNRQLDLVPDLDLIPFPARDLLQMQRYTFADSYYGEVLKPHASMMLYRGCEYQCLTCQVPRMFGDVYRKRSPENIVDEIKYLKDNYGVREVQFVGDNLFGDRKWAISWMEELIESDLGVAWSTLSGQSLFNLDFEIARLAVGSGMRSIMIDFPTGDEDKYDGIYNRPGSLEGAAQLVAALREAEVYVGGLFSLGAPGETRYSMKRTVNFALSLQLDELHLRVLTPFPGTPLWERCASRNLFERVPGTEDLLQDRGYIKTAQFSSRDVLKLQYMGRTRVQTREIMKQPDLLLANTIKFVGHGVIHPIDFVLKIFRYMGSYVGVVAPPEKRRRRRAAKPSASAPPSRKRTRA